MKNKSKTNPILGGIVFFGTLLIFLTVGFFIGYGLHHLIKSMVTFFTGEDLIGCYVTPLILSGYIGCMTGIKLLEKFKLRF